MLLFHVFYVATLWSSNKWWWWRYCVTKHGRSLRVNFCLFFYKRDYGTYSYDSICCCLHSDVSCATSVKVWLYAFTAGGLIPSVNLPSSLFKCWFFKSKSKRVIEHLYSGLLWDWPVTKVLSLQLRISSHHWPDCMFYTRHFIIHMPSTSFGS